MQPKHALTARLANLQSWRYGVTTQIARVADFLRENQYSNRETEALFDALTAKANRASVTVIFVAEAGRGKSELINALFFGDLGRRLLPSGILHATRSITEVRFDRTRPTGLSLLPIETREAAQRFADIYADETQWRHILFDADHPESIARAFAALAEIRRVSVAEAVEWGLHSESLTNISRDGGWVDVPRWRYAVINFPHPLLDAGLVVVDTPGLAALTAEPEFTRENLPAADAVVVVLDAGEGVTKPDLAIWKEHLGGARNFRDRERDEAVQARLVVMNKIDRLHFPDPLDPKQADRTWLKEVDKRVQDIADLMRIEPIKVLPVSAALALEGAFTQNQDLQLRSRLYRLERALAAHLPEHREATLGREILNTLSQTLEAVQADIDQSRFNALEGLRALGDLRKKNQALSEAISREAGDRRTHLINALDELRTVKPIHTKLASELHALTDPANARQDATQTAQQIAASVMPSRSQEALNAYFARTREQLLQVNAKLDEIRTLFGNLGERHFRLLGIGHHEVHPFATHRFLAEVVKAEEISRAELAKSSSLLARRGAAQAGAFETHVASRVVHVWEIAHRESASWMRGVFHGIERPLEEAMKRMNERSGKIEQIRSAELDLAEKIAELQATIDVIKSRHASLGVVREGLERYAGRRRSDESAT
jgi:hypothetical protein